MGHRGVGGRPAALAGHDATTLRELLHPGFCWTSHLGEVFALESYVRANTAGHTRWRSQRRIEPAVAVVGDVAVLCCLAVDKVEIGGAVEIFRMPMTQTWVREDGRWLCLAGHAGPRQIGASGEAMTREEALGMRGSHSIDQPPGDASPG